MGLSENRRPLNFHWFIMVYHNCNFGVYPVYLVFTHNHRWSAPGPGRCKMRRCEPMLPACVTFQTSLDKNQWRSGVTGNLVIWWFGSQEPKMGTFSGHLWSFGRVFHFRDLMCKMWGSCDILHSDLLTQRGVPLVDVFLVRRALTFEFRVGGMDHCHEWWGRWSQGNPHTQLLKISRTPWPN